MRGGRATRETGADRKWEKKEQASVSGTVSGRKQGESVDQGVSKDSGKYWQRELQKLSDRLFLQTPESEPF